MACPGSIACRGWAYSYRNPKIMGEHKIGPALTIIGWTLTILMTAVIVVMLVQ